MAASLLHFTVSDIDLLNRKVIKNVFIKIFRCSFNIFGCLMMMYLIPIVCENLFATQHLTKAQRSNLYTFCKQEALKV